MKQGLAEILHNASHRVHIVKELIMLSRLCVATTLVLCFTVSRITLAEEKLDTAKIEQLTGAKGKMDEKENVFKVTMPRNDLKVTAAGVKMTPPLGLACWAAFKNVGE